MVIKEITETQKDVAQFKNGISDINKEITKLKDELKAKIDVIVIDGTFKPSASNA